MKTGLLADYPQYLPTVSGWIYEEWGSRRAGSTLADVAERLQSHLERDRLPLMVVALDGAECVGCASLRVADLAERGDLTPWLASVYVPEARRRAGIGATLVFAAEAEARRLGVRTLYLFTPDRQAFYARLGWNTEGPATHVDGRVTIMRKHLGSSAPMPV